MNKLIQDKYNNELFQIFLAYSQGYFPMALGKESTEIQWIIPDERGTIPIGKIHCSKSLKKLIKKNAYKISFDDNFHEVISNCANRNSTWINSKIIKLFIDLHNLGFAHSVEVKKNNTLVGGLYGLSIGNIFFAESMFSLVPNASKLALIAIMAKINYGGYKVFDTQFPSDHLKSLGGTTLSKLEFKQKLKLIFNDNAEFNRTPYLSSWDQYLRYGANNN